ncbi:MAG: cupin domain-containing protein [Bacteroidia bacterium]|nr:cupin domain-containing protein [Bacteroidia bacterium]
MRRFVTLTLLTIVSSLSFAQETIKTSIIEPFNIDSKYLSGIDIPKLKLDDHPEREYFQKRLYRGSELSVFILSSETASNEINDFPIDEFVYYINGRADIKTLDSKTITFYGGDYLCVPKGFSGNWTNNGGNKYHLELSVITNQRADSSKKSNAKKPFLLDRGLLSGMELTESEPGKYKNWLYKGVELDIWTESESPEKREILDNPREQLIHILLGQLIIQAKGGEPHTYMKGDFFVLPKGFTGSWESKGQNQLRTLLVGAK